MDICCKCQKRIKERTEFIIGKPILKKEKTSKFNNYGVDFIDGTIPDSNRYHVSCFEELESKRHSKNKIVIFTSILISIILITILIVIFEIQ